MPRRADFLIIGSGIAGLRAAVDLADHGTVAILTKADPAESNTGYAQGGIAAAIGPDDAPEEHFADTMAAGDGLCDATAVRVMVDEGIAYVQQLLDWGAAFDRDSAGAPALGREGAHRVRRVLHARDATGREIGRLLWSRVGGHHHIQVFNHARACELVVDGRRCVGARYATDDRLDSVTAGAVLLATGGAGQVFRETTNPSIATGDGVALAWNAGARIVDLEFVQFHPTALAVPGSPRFLLSEALRGEGAHLVNAAGERFMTRYQRAGELASRDLVSRAIVSEMLATGDAVFLSLRHLDPEWVHQRFPTISEACRSAGLDLAREAIPVGPAAHYMMGGVETDVWARTTLPGLFAAGEVACTGVHGANRLASNSLLEGLVFGARAAEAMRQPLAPGGLSEVRVVSSEGAGDEDPVDRDAVLEEDQIRGVMWDAVGVHRTERELRQATAELRRAHLSWRAAAAQRPADDDTGRVSSLATAGWLIARAALRRTESRGAHFRTDFPAKDDLHWKIHVAEQRHLNG